MGRQKMSSLDEVIWGKKTKKRKPVPAKLRREKMTKPRKCKWCRKNPVQELHHIDGNPRNNKTNNLIALCGTCHIRATKGEITKEQLRKRLGIKKEAKRKVAKKRRRKKRTKTPLERHAERVEKLFLM